MFIIHFRFKRNLIKYTLSVCSLTDCIFVFFFAYHNRILADFDRLQVTKSCIGDSGFPEKKYTNQTPPDHISPFFSTRQFYKIAGFSYLFQQNYVYVIFVNTVYSNQIRLMFLCNKCSSILKRTQNVNDGFSVSTQYGFLPICLSCASINQLTNQSISNQPKPFSFAPKIGLCSEGVQRGFREGSERVRRVSALYTPNQPSINPL